MASELQKHTLLLYSGDYQRVQDLYPDIGAAVIIRKLLRNYLDKVNEGGEAPNPVGVNL